ncbi:outer membrane protein [Labrys neptuniae]
MTLRLAFAAILLTSTSAFAADLAPRNIEPAAPIESHVYNWTGFYAGLDLGASIGHGEIHYPYIGNRKYNGAGFLGGAHLGYNAQFSGNIVVGLETDLMYSSFSKKKTFNEDGDIFRDRLQNQWQGSTRARLGYAFDNILPYVTAGVAYGGVKTSIANWGSKSQSRVGWTAGAGVEYAIDQNWIIRGEVRYVDLGNKNVHVNDEFGRNNRKVKFNATDLTVGVSYKF